ncbi:putative ABC transporter permease [Serpentinicella sp. ANB-PHB4]|uniref:putative ABC transporter permease n=1 Tax=Serpentinicella sp. ANB-PHB4 TaxID=3074076 RepID=UPI00285DD033|nr:putative ABC transporter permease [Serpentinicella sp. ANB-PHB4]MDR5658461.1 putative ABC transporter permease [Serpentinicella sp. ANB-PHB4]
MDIYHLLFHFIIYAFLGWCIEVMYQYKKHRRFINRGFLYGPLCPIYGSGAVLLLFFLHDVSSLFLLFIGGFLIATFLELITGYLLEVFFETRWWDYSNEKFNLWGYVSLKFSVYWGLLTIVFVKQVHPFIEYLISYIPESLVSSIYTVFLIILSVDTTITISKMIEFHSIFVELLATSGEITDNIEHLAKDKFKTSIEKVKSKNEQLRNNYDHLIQKFINKNYRLFLRNYPYLKSNKYKRIIEEIKERLNQDK